MLKSKDIRSYFVTQKVQKARIEDDDDIIPESPDVQIKNKKKESRKKRVLCDDSDEEIFESKKKKTDQDSNNTSHSKNKPKTPNKPALKEVKAIDMFGNGPIKRTEPLVKKVQKNTETGIHSDEEFEKMLLELKPLVEFATQDFKKEKSLVHKNETEIIDVDKEKSPVKPKEIKEKSPVKPKEIKEKSPVHNKEIEIIKVGKEKSPVKPKEIKAKSPVHTKKIEIIDVDNEKSPVKPKVIKEKSPIHTEETKIIDVDKEKYDVKPKEIKKEESKASNNVSKDTYSKTKDHKSKNSSNMDSNNKNKTVENGESSKERAKAVSDVFSNRKEKKTGTFEVKNETTNHDKEKSEKRKFVSSFSKKESKRVENGGSTPKIEKKRDFSEFVEGNESVNEFDTPKNKKKKLDKSLNDSVLTDEERHERKMYSSALYQKYLNRSGPKHLGAKQIPEGPQNCLKDCAFLLTGVLDSFEREEVMEAITKYGGCVKNSMSRKVTHVLAGDDAGPAKMAKAQELGIRIINEDEFLQMIAHKKKIKDPKHGKSPSRNSSKRSPKYEKSDHKVIDTVKKESRPNDESKTKSNHVIKETEAKSIDKVNHVKKADIKPESKLIGSIIGLNGIKTQSSNSTVTPNSIMWVEKYKPQTVKQIIGQHGDASNVKKLTNWLTKWYVNRKAKLPKPSPWAKNDDGGYYKAALLSGPPGVGKTTTVALVCKELGFDTVEFNASDTRNKTLIKEQIGELLTTTSLSAYAKGDTSKQAVTKKHVLVMDEVDGMSGNEDRGGMQELIALIKSASVPIICMCNDRNSQKMRSLVNYCYDLRFSRPRVDQIKAALMSICYKEGIKIPPDALTQLVMAANQDVRQTLNLLSMWSVDANLADTDRLKSEARGVKKDLKLGPWEVIRKVFSAEEHKTMSLNDKSDLFFHDYSLAPLFVQENYLQVAPHCPKHELLERISKAADSISAGDLVDARIRSKQAWSLLPMQAMYSSVIPGHALSGHVAGQIQFPGWLGKNSRANKMHRLCQEIHAHTRLSTSGSKSSIFLDYCTYLRDAIITPLLKDKEDGVAKSLEVLEAYHLLREDLDSLTELSLWPGQQNPMILINSKIKAAMTRTYNKKAMALPYAPGAVRKGRARDDGDNENDAMGDEDMVAEEEEEENDSDPENDALIKKKKVKEEKSSTSKDKAGSSKGKAGSSKERPSSSKSKKK